MKKYPVIVVGGGIGGSSAAFYMAKAGVDVLMVEKEQFPRDKPCGDGIIPAVFPILRDMGIYEEMKANGWPSEYVRHIMANDEYFRNKNTTTLAGEIAPMYCVPRFKFDDMVNKAAVSSGIDYLENFEVTEIIMERGQAKGVRGIHNGKPVEVESDLIVLASGSHSMVARQMGFFDEDPDYVFYGLRAYFEDIEGMDEVEMYFPENMLPTGYIWLFPTSKTTANVGIFVTENCVKASGMTTEEMYWDWINNSYWGKIRFRNAKMKGELKGWRLPTGMHKPIIAPGVMAVGDAGNMIEQYAGGGIPQAMITGSIAARIAKEAIEAGDFSEAFLKKYSDAVHEAFDSTFAAMQLIRDEGFATLEKQDAILAYMREHEWASLTEYALSTVKDAKIDKSKVASK